MNFLGGRARFPEGPFVLAAAFNAPVSIVLHLKKPPTIIIFMEAR